MKTLFTIAICLGLAISAANAEATLSTNKDTPLSCNKNNMPKVIKPMENWDVIATNTATISTAAVFSGNHLSYILSTHPSNSKNLVTIDKATGIIQIKAEKKDNFDITVKASNSCGTASNTFNVIIDEDE